MIQGQDEVTVMFRNRQGCSISDDNRAWFSLVADDECSLKETMEDYHSLSRTVVFYFTR